MSKCGAAPFVLAAIFVGSSIPASPQTDPLISHEGLDCIPVHHFPVIDAEIDPGGDVRSAKVYFRSDKYPDFYYVEMVLKDNAFEAVLPMPAPETERIFYYVEAVDVTFNGARTEEYDPEVTDQCKRNPAAALPPTESPGIVVGATAAGVSALPPGFQAAGIAGFISSAGALSSLGGGVGAGTVAAAAAGAAGVAGTVVATSGGQEPTTAPSTTSTSSPSSTTSIPSSGTTTVPATSTVPSGSTTTTSSSTTTIPAGPTTTTPGPSTTTTTTSGSSTSSSTTTTSAPGASACIKSIDVISPGQNNCQIRFDGSCSTGETFEWTIDKTGEAGGPYVKTGQVVNVNFKDNCDSQWIVVELKVTSNDGASASTTSTTYRLPSNDLKTCSCQEQLTTSLMSYLHAPIKRRRLRGQVILNDSRRDMTVSGEVVRHDFTAPAGVNRVEAVLSLSTDGEATWRFDFSGAGHFVAGSIEVEQGQVVATEGYRVVFRLAGRAGERIRFNFRLAR